MCKDPNNHCDNCNIDGYTKNLLGVISWGKFHELSIGLFEEEESSRCGSREGDRRWFWYGWEDWLHDNVGGVWGKGDDEVVPYQDVYRYSEYPLRYDLINQFDQVSWWVQMM